MSLLSDLCASVDAALARRYQQPQPRREEPTGLEYSLDELFSEVCGGGPSGPGALDLVRVQLRPGGRSYTNAVPPGLHVEVGDTVAVPAKRDRMYGTVVAIGSEYTGPTKLIEAVITG